MRGEQPLYWVFFDGSAEFDSSFEFELAARSHALDNVDGGYCSYACVRHGILPDEGRVTFEHGCRPFGAFEASSGPRARLSALAEVL